MAFRTSGVFRATKTLMQGWPLQTPSATPTTPGTVIRLLACARRTSASGLSDAVMYSRSSAVTGGPPTAAAPASQTRTAARRAERLVPVHLDAEPIEYVIDRVRDRHHETPCEE